jgi:hypothetical protein
MFALGEILGVLRLRTVFRSRETSCSAQDDRLGERRLFAGGWARATLSAGLGPARASRPRPHCHTHTATLKPYNGMFPCFFGGFLSRLVCSISSAWISFLRVSLGWITASRNPRSAAM